MRTLTCSTLAVTALLVTTSGCSSGRTSVAPADIADRIYVNGTIVTVNDAQPQAEAVAVKGGTILAVGTRAQIEAHKGPATVVQDLGGKTMLPGFIDAHGHLSLVGLQAVVANLLPPPDGSNDSIAGVQDALRKWADDLARAEGLRGHPRPRVRRFAAEGAAPPHAGRHGPGLDGPARLRDPPVFAHGRGEQQGAGPCRHHGRHTRSARRAHPPAGGVERARRGAGGERAVPGHRQADRVEREGARVAGPAAGGPAALRQVRLHDRAGRR